MKRSRRNWFWALGLAGIVALGCNLSQQNGTIPTQEATVIASPEALESSPTVVIATPTTEPAIPTNTQSVIAPDFTATTAPPVPTATSGPICTVLQDLNLRPGPGTAYRPPIRALPAQTVLIPLGFNPTGVPGGPWVQVRDSGNNQIGWVSAGNQFVACNIDLTTLPPVAVAPPAPPPPPTSNNSTPDGTFPESFVWEADFDSQFFVRFYVHDTISGGNNDGDGITEVNFKVLDDTGTLVYERTERQAGFCIFGGGEPNCNPWVIEDFVYKWSAGGEAVREAEYKLLIVVIAESGDQGNWNYDISIDLPGN